jgi:hypothetical protein
LGQQFEKQALQYTLHVTLSGILLRLIYVRYKYDEVHKKRITTIEIIVDEKTWKVNRKRIPKNKIVFLHIEYGEVYIARLMKAADGK